MKSYSAGASFCLYTVLFFLTVFFPAAPVKAAEKRKPLLYASENTRDALGWLADSLPEWAGMDVLAIEQNDIKLSSYERDREKVLQAFHHFAEPIDGFPFNRFYQDWDVIAIAQQAKAAVPHGYPVSAHRMEERDVCVIILPSLKETDARMLASRIVGIDYHKIENLPGSAKDWQTLIIAHEARHCRHDPEKHENAILNQEYEADRQGINTYLESANNNLLPGGVPEALISLRAVASFLTSHNGHATSALLTRAGGGSTEEAAAYIDALTKARTKIEAAAGPENNKPRHLYRIAEKLYIDGAFDDNPIGKTYIRQFLDGARKYFPAYFGIPLRT